MRVKDTSSCLDTETHCYAPAQVSARRLALERIHARVKGRYTSLLDPMAGTGEDALLLSTGRDHTHVNDIDPACRELLRQHFKHVSAMDFFKDEWDGQPDLTFLDFNNWTQHKFHAQYRECTERVFKQTKRFVILNDTTFFYLRQYGAVARRNVGKLLRVTLNTCEDYETYLHDVGVCGWKAAQIEKFYVASPKGNGGAAYVLFENTL